MQCIFTFIVLFWVSSRRLVIGEYDIYQSILDDLREFNVTCSYFDTCKKGRTTDSLSTFSCHCGTFCAQLGTCCLDSGHVGAKQPKLVPACRKVYKGDKYFMVDSCLQSHDVSLCNYEWDGDDDITKIIPVTSLSSGITYKNYFCFRCHESTDEFSFWNVKLENGDDKFEDEDYDQPNIEDEVTSLQYNRTVKTWVITTEKLGEPIPVLLTLEIPYEIRSLTKRCVSDVISNCSDMWTDEEVRDKCNAYTAIKVVKRENEMFLKYRNVHCALCNFEDLVNVSCKQPEIVAFAGKLPFSFTHLLDINRLSGDKVGKVQKCVDNEIWDPVLKKCRKLSCVLPGYKVHGGKCVPE